MADPTLAQDPAKTDRRFKPLLGRLLERRVITPSGCWEWQGCRTKGYGMIRVAGPMVLVHRVAYEMWVGPIPEGADILHSCDNPPCYNPRHLRPGTHAENMAEAAERHRLPSVRGERNPCAKLTEDDVRDIRRRYALGDTQSSLGQQYAVDQTTISLIVRRKKWSHVA